MHLLSALCAGLAVTGAAARSPQHVNKKLPARDLPVRSLPILEDRSENSKKPHIIKQNHNTTSVYTMLLFVRARETDRFNRVCCERKEDPRC